MSFYGVFRARTRIEINGFRPIEITLLYLALRAFVILKLDDIMNYILSDNKIRDKMSGDINYQPGKYSADITLTEPLEKYAYICDRFLKTRIMILLGTSLIGVQLLIVTIGFKNVIKYISIDSRVYYI